MNIEELYGNVFGDNPIPQYENNNNEVYLKWLFPIVAKKSSEQTGFSKGTGFFVNNDGYFVTAGHVLKKSELAYFAIINNQEIEFKILYLEYLNIESQDGIVCRDLAICKLDLQSNYKNYLCEEDSNTSSLDVSGYKSQHQGRLAINPIKQREYYLHTYSAKIELSKVEIKLKFTKDTRYKCTNTNSLTFDDGLKYNGLSGGPVYLGKKIYGLLISNEYVLSSYIISKLDELGIKYTKNEI
jgi:hypothetical protein